MSIKSTVLAAGVAVVLVSSVGSAFADPTIQKENVEQYAVSAQGSLLPTSRRPWPARSVASSVPAPSAPPAPTTSPSAPSRSATPSPAPLTTPTTTDARRSPREKKGAALAAPFLFVRVFPAAVSDQPAIQSTLSGGLSLSRNSTVVNTSSVSPILVRSCIMNSPGPKWWCLVSPASYVTSATRPSA